MRSECYALSVKVTYNVVLHRRPQCRQERPRRLHKLLHHGEFLNVLLRIQLRNLANAGSNLVERPSFCAIVVIIGMSIGRWLKFRPCPGQILVKQGHTCIDVVFEEFRQVLTVEVIEDLQQQ